MFGIAGSRYLVLGSFALILAGCSGGGGNSAGSGGASFDGDGRTSLSISLIDAPVDDVTAVNLEITHMWLKAEGDGPAEELMLTESPMTVNLLGLTEDNAAILVDGAMIEPGTYEWLRMDVNASVDGIFDSYAETDTGEWRELRVPSGTVRLVDGFEIDSNAVMKLIFDWDLRKGLVYPPGLGGRDTTAYILKPAFRVIGLEEVSGTLSGSILTDTVANDESCLDDDPDPDVGNVVYVYAGLDVAPDDFDEEMDDVEPLAAIDTVLSDDSTRYEYGTMLPLGDYTVAFTCQAANDLAESNETGNEDPDDDSVAFFEPAVNVTLSTAEGEIDVVVDFGPNEAM